MPRSVTVVLFWTESTSNAASGTVALKRSENRLSLKSIAPRIRR